MKLMNPDETNIYDVLVKPDRFEQCLVIMGPYGRRGQELYCTVISLDRPHTWLNIHPSHVFVKARLSREAWNKWFDTLEDAEGLPVADDRYSDGTWVVLLSREGQGTCPLMASGEYIGNDRDDKVYDVSFHDYAHKDRPYFHSDNRHIGTSRPIVECNVPHLRLTNRPGTKSRVMSHHIHAPA